MKELKDDRKLLRSENTGLQQHVKALEAKPALAESDMENLKQYLRRDMLEIHGIPVTSGENTNSLAKKVVNLIEPDPTSNPGPFDIEAAREKALVKSGHVTPQILDIA